MKKSPGNTQQEYQHFARALKTHSNPTKSPPNGQVADRSTHRGYSQSRQNLSSDLDFDKSGYRMPPNRPRINSSFRQFHGQRRPSEVLSGSQGSSFELSDQQHFQHFAKEQRNSQHSTHMELHSPNSLNRNNQFDSQTSGFTSGYRHYWNNDHQNRHKNYASREPKENSFLEQQIESTQTTTKNGKKFGCTKFSKFPKNQKKTKKFGKKRKISQSKEEKKKIIRRERKKKLKNSLRLARQNIPEFAKRYPKEQALEEPQEFREARRLADINWLDNTKDKRGRLLHVFGARITQKVKQGHMSNPSNLVLNQKVPNFNYGY